MLTVYHAPLSRSSRILSLLEELGNPAGIRVEEVDIHRRRFNMGAPDPRNPHPEHKVPYLVDEGVGVRETTAIALHLAEMFPDSGLAISADDPLRGAFLAWLFWYAGVMEPVAIAHLSGVTSPELQADLRGMADIYAHLEDALEKGPWLVGGRFTVADLMAHSTFVWAAQLLPESPAIRDWVERCRTRPAALRARARDEAAFARLRAA